MRAAVAAIPDTYLALAMRSDAWFTFISILTVVIAGLQAFERTVFYAVERMIIWPFVQIRRTVYYSDSLMVEYFSATSAGLMGLWIVYGRDNSVADHIPEVFWVSVSTVLSVAQFTAAAHGTITSRAVCSVLATGLWSLVSIVLLLRVGFSLAHVFSLPMVLACWLSIFMLIAKGQPHGPTPTTE